MAKEAIDDRGGGARGAPLEPEQGLLPRARPHQARPRRVLRRGRRRRLPAPARAPDDDEALRRRGRPASSSSRSGCRRTRPTGSRRRPSSSPSGRSATELVGNDAAHLVWAVNLGVIDFNPWPARRADLDHPDELRVDLDPTPEVGFDEVRQVALVVREVLADHGLRRLPEDLGLARHPRQRAGRAEVDVHRGPPRGAGAGARGRAARPSWRPRSGGRRSATASSSTTTRTPATARSPRPTRSGRSPTRASPPRSSGTRSPTSTRPSFASTPCRRGSPSAAIPSATIDDVAPLARTAARARRPRRGRGPRRRARGRRTFAKQKDEPKRVQPSRAKKSGT